MIDPADLFMVADGTAKRWSDLTESDLRFVASRSIEAEMKLIKDRYYLQALLLAQAGLDGGEVETLLRYRS